MKFNANFKNSSIRSCWSVLSMEETGVPGDDNWPAARIEGIYLVIEKKGDEWKIVKDAFEQSCINWGRNKVVHCATWGKWVCAAILHGVITMYHTMLSLTTSLYLTLYCSLIWYTISTYKSYESPSSVKLGLDNDITIRFLLVVHVAKIDM